MDEPTTEAVCLCGHPENEHRHEDVVLETHHAVQPEVTGVKDGWVECLHPGCGCGRFNAAGASGGGAVR